MIDGLAKENPAENRIDVLSVVSVVPRAGNLKRFILALQAHYQTVCVWCIENPVMHAPLRKWGFTPETEIQADGEVLDGYRWDKS